MEGKMFVQQLECLDYNLPWEPQVVFPGHQNAKK